MKGEDRQKARFLALKSHTVDAKEKFLKNIKHDIPDSTQMIRKQNSFVADRKKVLVVWIENQARHNILLSQSLIQSKILSLSHSMKT